MEVYPTSYMQQETYDPENKDPFASFYVKPNLFVYELNPLCHQEGVHLFLVEFAGSRTCLNKVPFPLFCRIKQDRWAGEADIRKARQGRNSLDIIKGAKIDEGERSCGARFRTGWRQSGVLAGVAHLAFADFLAGRVELRRFVWACGDAKLASGAEAAVNGHNPIAPLLKGASRADAEAFRIIAMIAGDR